MRNALLRAGLVLGLATAPATAFAQKALVYCPPQDQTGCTAVVTALTGSGYPGGVDRAYDGTGGTVDIRTVDLFGYSVFVVPSLADDATSQPYAFLRDAQVQEHLRAALIGGLAVWSGTPDQGSSNRAGKDQLIRNLAGWAGASYAQAHGPGLVALLDLSETEGARYDWLRSMTPLQLASDVTMTTYDSVHALTSTGAGIAGSLSYASMAALGLATPTATPGLRLDVLGATGTSTGGQVVLATLPAGNTSTARIWTDQLDYPPGTPVTVHGSGWASGETVRIVRHEDPLLEADSSVVVIADGFGNFTDQSFTPDILDLYTRFVLTADGGSSGMRAQTTFTDAACSWKTTATDGNWFNGSNWSGCSGTGTAPNKIPASGDDLTIPSGASSYPTISSAAAVAKTIAINSGASVTVSGNTLTMSGAITNSGTFTVSGTGVLLGNQNFTTSGTATFSSSSATASTINALTISSGTLTASAGTLSIAGVESVTGTFAVSGSTILSSNTLTVNSGGNVNVTSGTLHMASALATVPTDNITISVGGTITQSGGSVDVHDFTTTNGAPDGTYNQSGGTFKQYHDFKNAGAFAATGGTIEFAGTGGGNAFNSPGTNQFFNVVVDNGVTTNFDSNLGASIGVAGDWTINGTATLTATATTVTFNGSGAQTIGGSSSTNFRNLTINKSGGTVSLSSVDATVGLAGAGTGTLTFTQGNIVTGANNVIIAAGGTVSRTSGHVVGNLRKQISANGTVSRTFEVGTGADYTPVDIALLTVAGSSTNGTQYLTASSTSGEHPSVSGSGLNSARDVNRYWTVTKTGTWTFGSYSGTFTFVPGDLDAGANTANFVVKKFNSPSTWTATTNGTRTATSTQGTGITSFSDFAVGEPTGGVSGTVVTSSQNPSTFGQAVTFTATVTSPPGSTAVTEGVVKFYDGGTSCTVSPGPQIGLDQTVNGSGVAQVTTSALSTGAHTVFGCYQGTTNFAASGGSVPQTVNKANTTTAITADAPDPSVVGQAVPVNYTVSVTAPGAGTPTGNVTVSDGTLSCTGTVAAGTCSITFTSAGAKTLIATYAGDVNFNGSPSAGESHTVNQAATTTAITSDTPDPSLVGQSVTVNYSVAVTAPGAGTPTGNVTVSSGPTSCTGTVAAGTCSLTFTTAGSHPLAATYAGDANFSTSTSAVEPHTVNKAPTTTSITSDTPDPSVVGQSVTVNFTVTSSGGTPTGNVTVSDGTVSCTGTVAAGTCSLTFTSSGAKTLTASYGGDANFDISTSAGAAHQVNPASTTTAITSDTPDPSVVGQSVPVNFSVTVNAPGAGTPTGNVTVSSGATSCTGTVAAGTCSITFTTAGSHPLTATYAGDANFSTSTSAAEPHTVNQAATTTTITSDTPDPSLVGGAVTVNYTVAANAPGSGTPTGNVTVSNGTTSCTGTVAAGTCSLTFPTAGSHALTATYAGDANFTTSTSAVEAHTVNKAPTTTTITSDTPDPSVVGQSVTVNYTVTSTGGSPTGNVTVSDGTVSCTGTVAAGTCSLTFTSAGAKTLTASYAGDANFDISTSAGAAHQVNPASTTTAITSDSPDPSVVGEAVPVNFTVSVTSPGAGTPTGNVTVSNGTTSCTGTVSAGTCSITFTTAGSHPLTATYAGDANFSGSTSATEAHTVNQAATTTTITSDTPDPSLVGGAVTVNFTVAANAPGSGTPTGNVTVSNGTTSCTGTVAAGTCSLTFSTAGSHPLTATYAGDANFTTSTSAAEPHTVNRAATTTTITSDTPDPSVVGQSVTVNYTVTSGGGTPTGNVTVSNGTTSCTGTVAAGTCSLTFTAAGSHPLTASYAGDANFDVSTSAVEAHTVNAASTTTAITSDTPDPSVVGQSVPVNFSVTVNAPGAGTPTGNVTVSDGTESCIGTVAAGTCSITFTSAGAKTLTATYAGDANFNGSASAGESHTVNQAATTTTITSDTPDPSLVGGAVTVNYSVAVTSPGAGTPTGNVTVTNGTTSCTGTVAAGTCSLTFNTAGSHPLTATYAGDANFTTSTSAAEPHQVNRAVTTTAITSDTPDPSVVGQSVTVNYTVTSTAGTPTGNVTVSNGTTSCTGTVAAGTCSLTFTSAGSHPLTASYAGDANFDVSTSAVEAHTVNPANTTTAITSDSPDPSVVGEAVAVNFSVTVTSPGAGTPTGNVTVSNGTTSCTGTVAAGTCSITFTTAGSHPLTATYAGDADFNGSTSASEAHTVNQASTTTTITSDTPDPSLVGGAVTVNYSVAVTAPGAGTPTGNVTVSNGTTSCTGTVAAGTCSLTFNTAGSHPLTATYAGDANFSTSVSAAEPHQVNRAVTTTTITSDTPDPSVVGQSVTVNYTVTSTAGTPTGNVTVSNGTTSCTGTVAAGTCSLTFPTAGSHPLTATYAGDANFDVSTSAVEAHTVNPASTTTTITSDSPDPSVVGQAVTVSYTVTANAPGSGTPTGNVTVSNGTTSCTGTVAGGSCSITFTTAGSHPLTATYAGDADFNGSTSASEAHTVNPAATTTTITSDTPDPSLVGGAVTVNYSVAVTAPGAGTPTGNVTVTNGTTSCTGTVAAGTCSLTFNTAGSHPLTATYAGDANFTTSTSAPEPHQVNRAVTTTAITSDTPDPSVVGQSVTVNYTVTSTAGTPTGNVTVSNGTTSCTGTVAAGTCSLAFPTAGSHPLTASYAGDANFDVSTSAVEAHTVNPASTTTTISSDLPDPSVVGQAVTVNYTVTANAPGSGTPTGNVTVSNGTTSCTGTVAGGSCSITFTTAGSHPLTATYAGDADFNGSTSAIEGHTVNQAATATTITSDTPDPSLVGGSVTVNYTVVATAPGSGTPTGSVTVSNGTTSCTGTVAAGTCSLTFNTAGSHPLTATYAGDANFTTSTSAAEPHTVDRAPTTTAITSDTPDPSVVGQSVTVNYTVTSTAGTPTGNVTVSNGTTSCTGTVAAGTCSLAFPTAGSHPLTASYAGDANFDVSTSAVEGHTVNAASTTTAITSDLPDPSVVGEAVTVNYTVTANAPGSGTPTGNVTVSNGTTSCTGTVASGSCSITFTTAGSHPMTATYAGDGNFNGSASASEAHTVNQAATTTTITSDSPDPSLVGQSVTVNYNVAVNAPGAGTPTGSVTVSNGTTSCTGTVAAGTCSLTFPTAGSHPLTATYAGDPNFSTSASAAEPHTVNRAATTTAITADTPDPSVVGQAVTVNYTVTSTAGSPTGNVTVSDGTVSCTGTVAGGSCSLTFTSAGAKTLTATYAGDANFDVSASAGESHQVNAASTTTAITSDSPDPSVVGETVMVNYTVSVTSPGSGTPTGSVTVSNGTTSCTGTVGAGTCSLVFTTAGSHPLTATYAGDGDFSTSTSAVAPHTVNQAATATTITSDAPDPSAVGQSVTVNYTVTVLEPGAGTPTGSVTVSNGTTSCTGTVAAGTCSLTFPTAGSHPLTATYAGDANFSTSTSATESHQVNRAATTTAITSDTPDPSVVGQSVTINFTVTSTAGSPTGNVTVSNGTDSCTGTVATGTCSITFTTAGPHPLTATYAGDANYDVSTSAVEGHTVNAAGTTTAITSDSPDPSVVGQSVTVNYTVSVAGPGSGTPTGNVTVSNGTTSCTGTVGAGSCSLTFTSPGAHPLTATYAGDGNFTGSASAAEPHTVNQAATTTAITSDSPDPSAVGQAVTINFSVTATAPGSGTPTGNVTVSNGTSSCTGTVAAGTCSITFTTAGPHPLTATYAGDANFSTSTSAVEPHSVTAAGTTTAITSDSPDPSVVGQSVTVNYSVTSGAGTPTGNVTVSDGTVSCTGTVAAGTCSLTFTSAGAKTLTATYAGDANFGGSTSAGEAHTVNAAGTTTAITSDTPDPSVVGQSVTVNYSVTVASPGAGTPTGNVTVSDGTVSCIGTVAAGTCSLTFTSAGAKTLTATYAGNANFSGSTSAAAAHTVNQAATTTAITSDSPDPSVVGQAVTVNYTVSVTSPGAGTPTGNVTVSDGTVSCTGTVAAGTCSITFTSAGAKTLTATYAGSANFSGSTSAGEPHTVNSGDTQKPVVSNTQSLPVALNTVGSVTATISDATTGGSKIVSWYFTIDGVAQPVVNIASGSQAITVNVTGSIPASSTTDVREICVYGTDAAGNTSIKMDCALQAIYDPSAGFVTGGGWINSPTGAYAANPSLTGKATFGFVSKYTNGRTIPTGNTEFQFQTAGFNFSSTVYEWLVVSGAMAQYKGSGTINGSGDYGFLLTAVDGSLTGGGGTDKFRIKVWNKTTGAVIYDNNMGASDTGTPTTLLGGGSIVIHR